MPDEKHGLKTNPPGLGRLDVFCQLGISRTGVDGMAVALDDTLNSLEAVFATDLVSERAAGLEFGLGQGPAHDALRSGTPCGVPELDSEEARSAWPLFSARASELGLHAVHAFPLSPFGSSSGAVSLYAKAPGGLTVKQQQHAIAVTELIGLSLIAPDAGEVIGIGLRMAVHQAAGMVMQQTGATIIDALVLLKATAFTEDLLVDDLAGEVLCGARHFRHREPDHDTE